MVDNRTPESRSRLMARIGSKNTAPELAVRRLLHIDGYRFRLHRKDLPGRPDIVFGARRKAIFVHGCFWHAHDCRLGALPKSRPEFWKPKRARNRARDAEAIAALKEWRWDALVVWQCETKHADELRRTLRDFLGPPGSKKPIDTSKPGR